MIVPTCRGLLAALAVGRILWGLEVVVSSRRSLAVAGLVLVACNRAPGLEPYLDTGDTEVGAVHVADLDPDWGPAAGGTAVTITGWGFEGVVEVEFGGQPASVTRLDTETLLATSPASAFEVPVDVTVRSELGEDILTEGFTYGTSGGGDDTDLPEQGIAGLVEMSFIQVACPQCFGVSSELSIHAAAAFHEPADVSWVDWMPGVGECTVNAVSTSPPVTTVDVGDWVYLNTGSRSIGLRGGAGSTGITYSSTPVESDFVRNASYTLSIPDGGGFLTAGDVVGVVVTPQGFDSIEPWQMLYVDPAAAFSAPLPRTGATVTWSPSGGSGSFVVLVEAYHPSSGQYISSVLCRGPDNGRLTVPAAGFDGVPQGALLAVTLLRHEITRTALPDGPEIEGVAQVGVMGTAVLR